MHWNQDLPLLILMICNKNNKIKLLIVKLNKLNIQQTKMFKNDSN